MGAHALGSNGSVEVTAADRPSSRREPSVFTDSAAPTGCNVARRWTLCPDSNRPLPPSCADLLGELWIYHSWSVASKRWRLRSSEPMRPSLRNGERGTHLPESCVDRLIQINDDNKFQQ